MISIGLVVSRVSGSEVRETDSPTPPVLVNNHVINNGDYNKDDVKDKNPFNDENHLNEGSRYCILHMMK